MSKPGITPGKWEWLIHDISMASLGVGEDPGLGDPLVMSVGPCEGCVKAAKEQQWKWGRCLTPNEADARLIAAAPDLLHAARIALTALEGRNSVSDKNARGALHRAIARALA